MYRNKLNLSLNKRKITVDENQDNILLFSSPVVITDNSKQWSGTSYDIKTLNIDTFDGKVTTDHDDRVEKIVANVVGLKKTGNKVTIDGLDFAKNESAYALLVYNLVKGEYVDDF